MTITSDVKELLYRVHQLNADAVPQGDETKVSTYKLNLLLDAAAYVEINEDKSEED